MVSSLNSILKVVVSVHSFSSLYTESLKLLQFFNHFVYSFIEEDHQMAKTPLKMIHETKHKTKITQIPIFYA